MSLNTLLLILMCANVAKQEEDVVVEVATICKGNTPKQLANLRRLVASMLDQSAGSKIRLTILSDSDSWPSAHAVLRKTIGHYYAKGVIFGHSSTADIHIDHKDLDNLISSVLDQSVMKTMKRVFGPSNKTLVISPDDPRRKSYYPNVEAGVAVALVMPIAFDLDLFYIAPFYHRLFPNEEDLIVVDLDLEFRVGIEQVHLLFSTMTSDQVVGLTPCQSPYYPFITGATDQQRRGLSTGVLLLKLKRMRESGEYNAELSSARMEVLAGKYLPKNDWVLAEQDWFSLLSWDQSHLVKVLPCNFNVFRCKWPPISPSPLFRNFPCNAAPAILHFCGDQGDDIIRQKSIPPQNSLLGWLSRRSSAVQRCGLQSRS